MPFVPLFALLIGINQYRNPEGFKPLRGAVNDVKQFKEYLVNKLHVPRQQINLLCNADATRRGIIQAFKDLTKDERIKKDNAIVIYFAGHGTQITAPHGWECSDPSRKIQSIASYDFCNSPGRRVPPIPDRVLNYLLSRISQKHGRNITVIFDCCFAASGTRGEQTPTEEGSGLVARGINLDLSSYPDDLDHDLLFDEPADELTRGSISLPKFDHYGLESHILLAACSKDELANERHVRGPGGSESRESGLFSSALLKLLYTTPLQHITYSNILSRLETIDGQNPQCEGTLKDRPLFGADLNIPTSRWKSFDVSYRHGNNMSQGYYDIAAGKFHHISESTEFAVYYENDVTHPLGTLRVTELLEFRSIAQPIPAHGSAHFNITENGRGKPIVIPTVLSYKEKLQMWYPPSLVYLYQHMARRQPEYIRNVHVVASEEIADIKLRLDAQNRLILDIFTSHTFLSPSLRLKWQQGISPDDGFLAFALSQAANFYSELKRPDNDPRISAGIEIEFFELQEDVDDDPDFGFIPVFKPSTYQNLYQNGMVRLNMSDPRRRGFHTPYGLKLTNKIPLNLYVNMYLFSNSSFSIVPFVRTDSHSPYKTDISLPAMPKDTLQPGSLTIGYGAPGYRPLAFKLSQDKGYDVDYLKIYLSTHPVDVSYVTQPSPFSPRSEDSRTPKKGRSAITAWSHVIIPILQQH